MAPFEGWVVIQIQEKYELCGWSIQIIKHQCSQLVHENSLDLEVVIVLYAR